MTVKYKTYSKKYFYVLCILLFSPKKPDASYKG